MYRTSFLIEKATIGNFPLAKESLWGGERTWQRLTSGWEDFRLDFKKEDSQSKFKDRSRYCGQLAGWWSYSNGRRSHGQTKVFLSFEP